MTINRAKEVCIPVWSYLAEFPRINEKKKLPKELFALIKDLYFECPLCEVFFKGKSKDQRCVGCPLEDNCITGKNIYGRWAEAKTEKTRGTAARRLLNTVLAWEP